MKFIPNEQFWTGNPWEIHKNGKKVLIWLDSLTDWLFFLKNEQNEPISQPLDKKPKRLQEKFERYCWLVETF